ncbi:MAG: hypothetical protein H6873_03640 [Hyphomicrobiaceae bacterium]|nr:hypothetical protein [Hyphomicrobiaceae bacterium]
MTETNAAAASGGFIGTWLRASIWTWIFRILVVACAAAMAYTWFQPWWSADVAIIQGTDDLVLHPWGVEVVRQVRATADPALYTMPDFFAPFTWTYFGLSMLAMAACLFLTWHISIGRIGISVAALLILAIGLSYLTAVGLAYYIGDMRAVSIDTHFIGRSSFTDPTTARKVQMVSQLRDGYWLALYAGIALVVLGLLRGVFIRWKKA